ncbi:MAG: sugar ABC transporter permease [Chloroflexi bacterium]|nr:sugar ABC transporter permease [Chloroflexota bacterium]
MIARVKSFYKSGPGFGLLLSLPSLLIMSFALVYPLARSITLSFRRMSLINPAAGSPFVGLENYIRLFTYEPYFTQVWVNTAKFVVIGTSCSFILGFVLAITLQRIKFLQGFLRTAFLLPYVMPTVVLTLLWMWMFNPSYGIINYVLKSLHLITDFRQWFSDPKWAMVPLLAIYVWKGSAFHMIMLLAGLQNIPLELYEAARVDGANAVQRFRYVTLPQMRHVITVLLLLSAMHALQYFTPIWVLTRGGPGFTTTTLSIYIYKLAFERYDFGLAAAVGTLWFLLLAVGTYIILRVSRKQD